MKTIIIAMSIIAITFSSCQKQENILPVNDITATGELQTDATHIYHGKIVTYQNEIASYMHNQSAILFTHQITGKPEFYYFDTKEEELDFLSKCPALKDCHTKALQAKDMREYAISSGEITNYNITGEVSAEYLRYIRKYVSRGYYTLHDKLGGLGTSFFVTANPVLPTSINDKAESYSGNFNTGTIYTGIFYSGVSLTFANGTAYPVYAVPYVNLPLAFRNSVSSAK